MQHWGGPYVSVAELEVALTRANDEAMSVTFELTFYKLTHPTEFTSNKHLFRVLGIFHNEKLEDLKSVLGNEEDMLNTRIHAKCLPTNADVLLTLQPANPTPECDDNLIPRARPVPHPF